MEGLPKFLRGPAGGKDALADLDDHSGFQGEPRNPVGGHAVAMAPEMLRKHPHPFGEGAGKRGSGQMPPSTVIWQERPFLPWLGLPSVPPERG